MIKLSNNYISDPRVGAAVRAPLMKSNKSVPLDSAQKVDWALRRWTGHWQTVATLLSRTCIPAAELDLPRYQFFVEMMGGKVITLLGNSSATIEDVKDQLQYKKGFPPHWQRIVFHGMQFEDFCTLAECNINKEDIGRLFLNFGGGRPMLQRCALSPSSSAGRCIPRHKTAAFQSPHVNAAVLANIHVSCTLRHSLPPATCLEAAQNQPIRSLPV